MEPTKVYDICIASDWEYDRDFIELLQQTANHEGLSTIVITPEKIKETYQDFNNGSLVFRYLFDRASDTSDDFLEFHNLFGSKHIPIFETVDELRWASDKATMHLEFIAQGLHTPFTIIIAPFKEVQEFKLSLDDLSKLGRPFFIKPANTTGGGIGVVNGAETLQDVLTARCEYKYDKYLLQEKIIPQKYDEKRFWFRAFYTCGLVQITWWNDLTHYYYPLTHDELEKYNLQSLPSIVEKIAGICKLKFFSTEIVLNQKNQLVVVDYVNESCDMRMQSRHFDGVPDEVAHQIARQIIMWIKKEISK